METQEQEIDIFIKDEGYAAVKFLSDRAKEVAFSLGISNTLAQFGDTFCGNPVWNETTRKGVYACGFRLSHLKSVVADFEAAGLVIDSEFNLAIL